MKYLWLLQNMGNVLRRASKLSAKGVPFSNLLAQPEDLQITKTLVSTSPFSATPSVENATPVAAPRAPASEERTAVAAGVRGVKATLTCVHRLIVHLSKSALERLHNTWNLMTVENTIPLLFLSAMLAFLMHRFQRRTQRLKELALPPNEWLHIDNKPYATD